MIRPLYLTANPANELSLSITEKWWWMQSEREREREREQGFAIVNANKERDGCVIKHCPDIDVVMDVSIQCIVLDYLMMAS